MIGDDLRVINHEIALLQLHKFNVLFGYECPHKEMLTVRIAAAFHYSTSPTPDYRNFNLPDGTEHYMDILGHA